MKSDLHETFRKSSWVSPKMIQHVKDDPILEISSQEPSSSSKYDFEKRKKIAKNQFFWDKFL